MSSSHNLNKDVCKSHNNADQVNEVTGQTQMLKGTESETEDSINYLNSNSPNSSFVSSSDSELLPQTDEVFKVTISNMKYAANFPVTINQTEQYLCSIQGQLFHACIGHALTNYNLNQS